MGKKHGNKILLSYLLIIKIIDDYWSEHEEAFCVQAWEIFRGMGRKISFIEWVAKASVTFPLSTDEHIIDPHFNQRTNESRWAVFREKTKNP
jgi:hypothetical protein